MTEIQKTGFVEWMYPGLHGGSCGEGDTLTIRLMHVRAANDLVVRYDSERDGWSLLMDGCDPDAYPPQGIGEYPRPREVAFVPAWCPVGRGSRPSVGSGE